MVTLHVPVGVIATIAAALCGIHVRANDRETVSPETVRQATSATPQSHPSAQGANADQGHLAARTQDRLSVAATRNRSAIVYLGVPGVAHGTGFVVSRKYRLVVTAAHVADMWFASQSFRAFLDGQTYGYRVTNVWQHPSVYRKLDDGLYVRSFAHADGSVDCFHDVALMQLESNGPDLPVELALGVANRDVNRISHVVGLLDYAQSDDQFAPAASRPARAHFTSTLISPVTVELDGREILVDDAVVLELPQLSGASGAPVFAPDGHVAAVITSGRYLPHAFRYEALAVQINVVYDIIRYHELEGLLDMRSAAPHSFPVFVGPDPKLNDYRLAVRMERYAESLRRSGKYREAVESCDAALRLCPEYGRALIARSKCYLFFVGNYWAAMPDIDRERFISRALADSKECVRLYPQWNYGVLINTQNEIYHAVIHQDRQSYSSIIVTIDHLLQSWHPEGLRDLERSFAINCRAQARHLLGELNEAESDYTEAIRLTPGEPQLYINRAQFWESTERRWLGTLDREKAKVLLGVCAPAKQSDAIRGK